MPTARFAPSAFRIAPSASRNTRARFLLADGAIPGKAAPPLYSRVDPRIIERPHYHVHGRGQQRVGKGA